MWNHQANAYQMQSSGQVLERTDTDAQTGLQTLEAVSKWKNIIVGMHAL